MPRRQSGILTVSMLRPRIAGAGLLALAIVLAFAPMAAGQAPEPGKRKKEPHSPAPQTYEESTRFLKSLPPKPATQLPFPSINTPPIEDQAPIPLLTESQQKQQEEELTRLGKTHGQPKAAKQGAKPAKSKDKPKQEAVNSPAKKPKTREASKPLSITK
jgi:hypothetical protein